MELIGEKILGSTANKPIRLALFASGNGTVAESIMKFCQNRKDFSIEVLITDKTEAGVIERAREFSVPTKILPIEKKKKHEQEDKVLEELSARGVDVVCLAGYMRILSSSFLERSVPVFNIHPSLLPAFPGADGYGDAFRADVSEHGCTIHLVDSGIDTGPIVLQKKYLRNKDDDFETFKSQGMKLEYALYGEFLQLLSQSWPKLPLDLDSEETNLNPTLIEIWENEKVRYLDDVVSEAQDLFNLPLDKMLSTSIYTVLGESELKQKVHECAHDVFCDPVSQSFDLTFNEERFSKKPQFVVTVGGRPGVTDNAGFSAGQALELVGVRARVASGKRYYLFGKDLNKESVLSFAEENLANLLIQSVDVQSYSDFRESNPFENAKFPQVKLGGNKMVETINLDLEDEGLVELSTERCLALTLDEMQTVKNYYSDSKTKKMREEQGLPQWPTDVELEVIAQTWSEHCKHKIFAANIDYSEDYATPFPVESKKINSLFKTYVKRATDVVRDNEKQDWLISVFSDNAGIVRFDEKLDLCIKVETHNSPSALDPYGGAITGILGVNRDILGCGMGARPIANTDVFCFADPNWPKPPEYGLLPKGPMHPRRIITGVHKGVEDGGNKSGIPTVNGAFYFDRNFAGKPLVFVGTVGAMPQKCAGIPSETKNPRVGDRIIMAGGLIGQDGIHGATFSSMELNENSPATAVQIGDPLTQKRLTEFLMEARDLGLYTCTTDNGAGGLSSSVGEMAELTGGATIDLAKCPVKYQGLCPYELMISESQERMTIAVDPKKLDEFLALSERRGVVSTDIGEFTDSGELKVLFNNEMVANLNLEFLHDGLPEMNLKATWNGPTTRDDWTGTFEAPTREFKPIHFEETMYDLLSRPNIASKESWVRRYDHEVQAATHIKPFVGKQRKGPGDSGVMWLAPHGGSENGAVAVGCGLNPKASLYDPYLMAQYSVDEAVRNVVVSGGNPDRLCLLDNFCWPDPIKTAKNPEGDYKLGQLVRTCEGLYDICVAYGAPLVSGKDSMKNDFKGVNRNGDPLEISILPTLLVTAMAQADIQHTVTSDFKKGGHLIYQLGHTFTGLYGSEFSEVRKVGEEKLTFPQINIEQNRSLYRDYYELCKRGLIQSGHDISDGGLAVALAESCIGGNLGLEINCDMFDMDLENFLFSEGAGRFVVSINPKDKGEFEKVMGERATYLGLVSERASLNFVMDERKWSLPMAKVLSAWQKEVME